MKTIELFEYSKPMVNLENFGFNTKTVKEFKSFLDEIWQIYKREKPRFWRENTSEDDIDEDIAIHQRFLYFDELKVKSRNYVGYIKYDDWEFKLYPKICPPSYNERGDLVNKNQIIKTVLLWLNYSNDLILPNMLTGMEEIEDNDFIEILIRCFSKYTADLFSHSLYKHYVEVTEDTQFLKGKLNISDYIKNITLGKPHLFNCTYDSFELNNLFNKIVKFVSKSLLQITKNNQNKDYLSDIIKALDEVDDKYCTIQDCESVYINRFMGEFAVVLDYCKLFLNNSVSFIDGGNFENFAFLIRTETLFEDFITNFSQQNIPEYKIVPQSKSYLDKSGVFGICPDLKIFDKKGKLIKVIDVKYKNVKSYDDITHSDIHQCVTYSKKLGCTDVVLLYPTFGENRKLEPIVIDDINLSFKFIDNCTSPSSIETQIINIISDKNKN